MPRPNPHPHAHDQSGPAPSGDARTLGPRERQVLEWLVQGQTTHDIAQRLNRPERAVEHHVAEVLARFGVTTPAEALAAAGPAPAGDAPTADAPSADTPSADAPAADAPATEPAQA